MGLETLYNIKHVTDHGAHDMQDKNYEGTQEVVDATPHSKLKGSCSSSEIVAQHRRAPPHDSNAGFASTVPYSKCHIYNANTPAPNPVAEERGIYTSGTNDIVNNSEDIMVCPSGDRGFITRV